MSAEISNNINVPGYADVMEPDFSTSTEVHKFVSKIVLMKSTKEYFEYTMDLLCGIPAIEMKGTEEDWENLGIKIKILKEMLSPLHVVIGLHGFWWNKIEKIASKLLDTYRENPDKVWWSKIITEENFGSGENKFKGWFMADLLNNPDASGISDAPRYLFK